MEKITIISSYTDNIFFVGSHNYELPDDNTYLVATYPLPLKILPRKGMKDGFARTKEQIVKIFYPGFKEIQDPTEINKNNFYNHTKAYFSMIDDMNVEPDHISQSGSKYWFVYDGVVRQSDHWGYVRNCYWDVDEDMASYLKLYDTPSGFCSFENFKHNH